MKLDRNNYEEFFLLYVDNELTTEQKKSVEQFVQENADLAMELELLQQTVLPTDNKIVFEGKQSLLKTEGGSLINMSNYEEYLISYIDDELNPAERNEFELFSMAHPQVKEELNIYLQTKLEPEEEIVFANKEILYRREEKVRVISMQWRRVAVAAAVLLIAGVGTIAILNKKDIPSVTGDVASAKTAEKKTNNATATTTDSNTATQRQQQAEVPVPEETNNNNIAVAPNEGIKTKTAVDKKDISPAAKQQNNELQQVRIDDNNIAKTDVPATKQVIPNPANNSITQGIEKSVAPPVRNDIDLKNTIAAADKKAVKENTNKSAVTNNPEFPSDNKEVVDQEKFDDIYASNNDSKNRKLRGFFRKATRVFEKRTNISATDDNEERVMIGALAVKLK